MHSLIKYLKHNVFGLLTAVVLGASVSFATGWNAVLLILIFVASYVFLNFDIGLIVKYIEIVREKKLIAPNSDDKVETMSKLQIEYVTDLKQ